METGMEPVNWFEAIEKNSRFGRDMPISDGRLPWKRLNPISKAVNEERLKIEGGMTPESLLSIRFKILRFFNFPRVLGTFPNRILFFSSRRISREDRFPKEGGIVPVRPLTSRVRFLSFNKEPSSIGISPVRLLNSILIEIRLEQSDMLGGI
jgi:hypothetical protein